jgi:hypothetical protein
MDILQILQGDCDNITLNSKGGAHFTTRATKRFGLTWKYLVIVEAKELCPNQMLSLEWSIKYLHQRDQDKKYSILHKVD